MCGRPKSVFRNCKTLFINNHCRFAAQLFNSKNINMRKLSFAIILACLTLSLAAQDVVKVKYRGAKPTISDFSWAYLSSINHDEDECGDEPANAVKDAWVRHRKGLPQEKGVTLIIDEKNGYVLYEHRYDDVVIRMEMCYWNEADGKHKLFVFNNLATTNSHGLICTETSGLTFYRYNNATKKMTYCDPPGFKVEYDCSYAMPRAGKDITVTKWDTNGKKLHQKTLKWNGRRFGF